MARTNVVVRKSSITPPSGNVPLVSVGATVGIGAVQAIASARRLPAGVMSTAIAGTAVIPAPASDVTSFSLTSSVSGTNTLPFTLGHAFKQGDVPTGQFIVSDLATFQADVRNRWPDGSVKFAVLSGRKSLAFNTATPVIVRRTSTNPGGTNIALSVLQALNPSASMALSGFGTVTLATLLSSPVRSILGPQMSEFHFRSAVGADAHLAVWFYCRLYADSSLEIETCVENGYMKVAGPVDKVYTATLTINGTVRYTGSLTHWPRTRWFTINWYNGTSGLTDFNRVVPSHDHAYLRSTKLVPNYTTGAAPSSTYLNGLTQTLSPLTANPELSTGGSGMSGPGAHDYIGILTRWAASYCLTGDARAYRALISNCYSNNTWPVCYRDEATQRPLAITTRPNIDVAGWGIDPVVAGTGSNPRIWFSGTQSHHPECGYTAYLVSGRWTCLETLAFWGAMSHMEANPTSRGLTINNGGSATIVYNEDRGRSWHHRTISAITCMYPDSGPTAADQKVRDDWIAGLGATFGFWQSTDLTCPLGYLGQIFNGGAFDPYVNMPDLGIPSFMGYFHSQVMGWTWDLEVLTGTARTNHQLCRDHYYKFPVGMLGDNTGWCFRAGPQFVIAAGTITGVNGTITWDSTWAAAYNRSDTFTGGSAQGLIIPAASKPCTAGGSIQTGNFPDATSYGANLHPAIAYAVEHGATGASAAYARFTAASNYPTFQAGQVNAQQWAIVPRADPAVLPSWYPASEGVIVQIPGSSTIGSAVRANGGDAYNAAGLGTDPDDIVEPWSGGALIYISGVPYLIAMGGGHGDSAYNGIVKYGPLTGSGSDTPSWTAHKAPSPTSAIRSAGAGTFPTNLDGLRVSNHEYNNLVGVGPTIYAMAEGGCWPADQQDGVFALTSSNQVTLASNPHPAFDGFTGGSCAYYSGKIYYLAGNSNFTQLGIYTIATNAWSASGGFDIFRANYACSAVDTTRGAMLNVNSSNGIYWNLNTLTRSTGKAAPTSFEAAMVYDPDRDAFVSFVSSSTQVRECSAASLASGAAPSWTTRTFSGVTPQASPVQGMFGRFQYVPELKGYICAPNLETPTYFYRSGTPSSSSGLVLGMQGDEFTINGTPTFLLGSSYFQALDWHQSDIDALATRGYNWIRIFLENDPGLAALLPDGTFSGATEIAALVDYCASKGIIVEVVVFDWEWGAAQADYFDAIANVTAVLAGKTNIFYDVLNEHNFMGGGFDHTTLGQWISAIRAGDPDAIICSSTARGHVGDSFNNSIITADVDADLATGVDFMAPHFNRESGWDTGTDDRVTNLKNYLASVSQNVPVLLTEEARMGPGGGASSQSQFETALTGAVSAGAAGWLFHHSATFNLSGSSMMSQLSSVELATLDALPGLVP